MKSNKGYIIGVIQGASKNQIDGYRLWFNGSVKDVSFKDIYSAMYGSDCVENAKISNGEIIGINGSLDRYARISPMGIILHDTVIIIKKIGLTDRDKKVSQTAYQVLNPEGKMRMLASWQIIGYAEHNGLANGKIVTKGDTKFISAIEGEYPYEEIIADLFFMEYDKEPFMTPAEQKAVREALKVINDKKAEIIKDKQAKLGIEDAVYKRANLDFRAGVRGACIDMGVTHNVENVDGITTIKTREGHYATVNYTSNGIILKADEDTHSTNSIAYVAARTRAGNIAYVEIRAMKYKKVMGVIDRFEIQLPDGDEDMVADIMYEEGKQQAYKMNRSNLSGQAIAISHKKYRPERIEPGIRPEPNKAMSSVNKVNGTGSKIIIGSKEYSSKEVRSVDSSKGESQAAKKIDITPINKDATFMDVVKLFWNK